MTPETSPEPRTGIGPVVLCALALLLILGATSALAGGRTEPLDGRQRLSESFQVQSLPHGLPVARALRLPGGEELVQLGESEVLDEDARIRAERPKPEKKGGHGHGHGHETPDPVWKTFGPGTPGAPFEITFIWYPEKKGERALRNLFGSGSFGDIGSLGKEGGQVLIEGGTVYWDGYDVPFRRIRSFQRVDGEPTYVDILRANLTRGRVPCVVFLRWQEGVAGSKAALTETLGVLAPLDRE